MAVMLVHVASAVNFGGPSPDTGEADGGWHTGVYAGTSGNHSRTWTLNTEYFAVEREINSVAAANQTLAFNVSIWSFNSTIKITGINGTLAYCYSRRASQSCIGPPGETPQGTPGKMNILIQNGTNSFVKVSNLPSTSHFLNMTTFNVTGTADFLQFINSSGFINLRFEFAYNGSGRSAFLNENTNLTVTYDSVPSVTLSTPANRSSSVSPNQVVTCNATDDIALINVALYHDVAGLFKANQTRVVSGKTASVQFNITNIATGDYSWNCLAEDGVFSPVFAPANFTFSIIADNYPNATLVSPPDSNSSTNTDLTFISNLADDISLKNATLYINSTGVFLPNQSIQAAGTTNTTSFAINNLAVNTTYLWNVLVCDSSKQCSFAQANYTFAIAQEQQNQSQPSQPQTPGQSSSSQNPSINNPYSDSGFDKAALAKIASQERAQAQQQPTAPQAPESTQAEKPTEVMPATKQPTGLEAITGAATTELKPTKGSYALLLALLALLLAYVIVRKLKIRPSETGATETAFKSDWKVDHDNYGKKHETVQNAPAQEPKRLTFYDLYEHFPETYKEIRSKGMITLPNKKIEVSKDRTLSPKDLKAMFPSSLGKIKEDALKPYTPVNRTQQVHPVLKEIGIQENVYQIVKPKHEIIPKPELLPTRKINKLDKPKNRIIEGLKGVYKTG